MTFTLTTAASELVSRFIEADQQPALPVLLAVLEREADERRARRVTRLRRASKLPPGKTFDTLDEGRLPATLIRKLRELGDAMALWAPFEQFIYRSAAEREGRENARSIVGDLDLTIYSLRKWMRLALKGNPTILLLLFTPDDQLVQCDSLGRELRSLAPQVISRRVQGPYLGYLQAQKQRLTGERGQKRIHRPELEEMYGFDTKYAMHMLRLGFQGVELLTTGRLSLPMREPERSYLLDVRRGKISEQECLARAGELERELTDLETTSSLPEAPEETRVEEWVLDAYRRSWRL